ncbi:MAG TPA: hypothetical protein VEV81_11105, partial [Pyrinomonadaceae bacterium]|nr:hypothetical protein [Pyrinomonadaceae bacterium]
MAVAQGKSPAERNKMIAAIVLGAMALISLAYMFLGGSSSKTTTTTTAKPSPTTTVRPVIVQSAGNMPPENFIPTPIVYSESPAAVPEAGRNIFAFYVPPPPTPKPSVAPTVIPTPTPVPPN